MVVAVAAVVKVTGVMAHEEREIETQTRFLFPVLFELEAPLPFEVLVSVVVREQRYHAIFAW